MESKIKKSANLFNPNPKINVDEWGADVVSNVDFEESFGRGEDGFGDFMGEVCFYNGYFIFKSIGFFVFL